MANVVLESFGAWRWRLQFIPAFRLPRPPPRPQLEEATVIKEVPFSKSCCAPALKVGFVWGVVGFVFCSAARTNPQVVGFDWGVVGIPPGTVGFRRTNKCS